MHTCEKRQTERPKSLEGNCKFLKRKMFRSNKAEMFNLCVSFLSVYLHWDIFNKNVMCPVHQRGTKPSVYVFKRVLELFWIKYNTMHENMSDRL